MGRRRQVFDVRSVASPSSYLREGDRLILLLCGGDKSTQSADIAAAHDIARQWRTNRGGDR